MVVKQRLVQVLQKPKVIPCLPLRARDTSREWARQSPSLLSSLLGLGKFAGTFVPTENPQHPSHRQQ